jgi:hypothetical protein
MNQGPGSPVIRPMGPPDRRHKSTSSVVVNDVGDVGLIRFQSCREYRPRILEYSSAC